MKSYEVQTKIGTVKVTPTERDHIYVDMPEVTVRGVRWRGSIHLYRWSAGCWQYGPESKDNWQRRQYVFITRPSIVYNKSLPSESARKAIIDVIIPAVSEWVAANTDKVEDAEATHVYEEIRKRKQEILDMEIKIRTLRDEISELARKFHGAEPK